MMATNWTFRAAHPCLLLMLAGSPALPKSAADGTAAAQEGDPARAIAIWRPLAEAGNPEAQYWLAQSHRGGWWGVPEDLAQVAFWHGEAARQGHVPSYVQLGRLHDTGVPFRQDHLAAATWFARVALAGNAEGQYEWAILMLRGQGVARDVERGQSLLQAAAAQGHDAARAALCAEVAHRCTG